MSDDLRTRIATALYGDGNELPWPRCLQLSDLVLWELGLKIEHRGMDGINRHWRWVRHVTDWRECD